MERVEKGDAKVRGDHDHYNVAIELGDDEKLVGSVGGGGERRRVSYVNSLSPRQMDTLTALCDTFLPSIAHPHHPSYTDSGGDGDCDEEVAKFYRTSASMAGTPEKLGGLISERIKHPKLWLLRLTLWFLSTCIGTFILCGQKCFSSHFPYVQRFPEIPQRRREEIVRRWSRSVFPLLRIFARTVKLLTFLVFFTQVDEKDHNVSWKAIGYAGPDPEFENSKKLKRTSCQISADEQQGKEQATAKNGYEDEAFFGPLHQGLIHMVHPRDIVTKSLRQFGFPVLICPSNHNVRKPRFPSLSIQCDAVVIGSGAGGGVVAGVLAKAGYKVLVLEKGSYCARSNLSLLEGPTMDQMYLSGGVVATEDMSTLVLAGSTVGGGSTINWSASLRTPQHVMNEWSNKYDLELFDSKLYREALDVVCKRMGVQSAISEEGFNNAVLRKGCQELGYPVSNIPRNSPADHYCGWCCLGCKDGKKKGTAETWLVDLVESGNGAILPGCEAIEVLHSRQSRRGRDTATGVTFEFEHNGVKEVCIIESKVTIVACGALSTPALLKRSGLKNPNIGKNLHLHPVTMAWGYFPDTEMADLWPEKEKKSYEGGIMTAMSTVVGNFNKSGYGAVIQTPALHPGMFSALMPWTSGLDMKERMTKFSRTAHLFTLARDKGSGTITSSTSISYKMDDADEQNLQKGLEKVLRILAAAGAEEIGSHHGEGKTLKVKQVSYHEFEQFVKEESARSIKGLSTPICSAHQMGSCRMGPDPRSSAVNPMGETWEVEGLYVADTSVFPTALGVNPMVTVQAIAYCTAQSVLEALRRKKSRE
ncbi:long-chain-alcohol oxidase FAO4A [Eucalyptus grandis]|uniref:long-chain-alcohol oxidase FAO4A n=1 Tax=Eucalyptus grandis TaxID=71139 RepID=UPI00192E9448|nr:long-chain-alcohol oxidase FAO4A [Eucalyptus grandis]